MVVAVAGVKLERHVGNAEHHGVLRGLKKIAARLKTVDVEVFRLDVHDRSGNYIGVNTFVLREIEVKAGAECVVGSLSRSNGKHGSRSCQKSFLHFAFV